jgi:hypothetical protein
MSMGVAVRQREAALARVGTQLVSQREEWPNGGREPWQIPHDIERGHLPCLHAHREQEIRSSALSLRPFVVRAIGDMIPLLHPRHKSEDGVHRIPA